MRTTRDTTRTFIAIAVPEPLDRQLTLLQSALASEAAGWRWTSSLPFHATLAFLGDVRNRDLSELGEAVAASAATFDSFELHLEGLGAFPTAARPRVLWAGLNARQPAPLLDLREAIVRAVLQVGYHVDDQKFHPHLTLGRIKPHRGPIGDLTGLVERYRGWSGGHFTVDEVATFASVPGPAGPSYCSLSRAPLAGKENEAPP
jgi:2'-5' RNA ligase